MALSTRTRLLFTWLILSAITLVAWGIGARHGAGIPRPDAAVAIGAIAITVIKVRVILREFMDVRHAPASIRHVADAWLGLFAGAMIVAYFV